MQVGGCKVSYKHVFVPICSKLDARDLQSSQEGVRCLPKQYASNHTH